MEQNRIKLIGAARKAFAASGFAAASMDDITAQVGLTRGALYHGFGDKKGLLGAVVAQVDGEMAARAQQADDCGNPWERLLAVGEAYIGMALDPEVRRIVLLDGPAFLGRPFEVAQPECVPEHHEAGDRRFDRRGCHEASRYRGRVTPSERHGIQRRSMDCRQRPAAHRLAKGDRGVPANGRRVSGESRLTVIRQSRCEDT